MSRAISTARVRSEMPGRYMRQLCSHFAHKVATECNGENGRADFAFAVCRMRAEPECLVLVAEAESQGELVRVQQVVASHLVRFAWRETLEIVWE